MSDTLKQIISAFVAKEKPSGFLVKRCKKVEQLATVVEFDKKSIKNVYSPDTGNGLGARHFDMSQYNTINYEIPAHNSITTISPEQLYKKQFGGTILDNKGQAVIDLVTERLEVFSDMQRRSEEKQVSDGILNGKIVLTNGAEIEFNRNNDNNISATALWSNESATPTKDISNACDACVENGMASGAVFNLILNKKDIDLLLASPDFQSNAKRHEGINRVDVGFGVEKDGAVFHGRFSVGSYSINLLTYAEKYAIPVGFGFAGEGTKKYYIPQGKAIIMPDEVDFEMRFGGLTPAPNNLKNQSILSIANVKLIKAQQLPYAYCEIKDGEVYTKAGLKSRPLFLPREINQTAVITGISS